MGVAVDHGCHAVFFESGGDGTFTVVNSKIINTHGYKLDITAWDVDISGSLSAGTASTGIFAAQVGQSIGLGQSTGKMHVANTELQRISSTGITVGGPSAKTMIINGVTAEAGNHITEVFTLLAKSNNGQTRGQHEPLL